MIQHEQWQDNPVCGEARPVSASRGSGNQGRVQLPTLCTWADLCALAKSPSDSDITNLEYQALTKQAKQGLKKKDPFILFGICTEGIRDDAHLLCRSAVTLDIDEDAADLLADLMIGMLDVPFAYVWHTTRSHTSDDPRLRVIIPLSRDVTLDEYRPLVVTLSTYFNATLDPAAIKPSQMMYLPVRNSGAPYEWGSATNKGYADPDHFLKLAVTPGTALAPAANTAGQPRTPRESFDAFLHGKDRTNITLEQAGELLARIDPDRANDDWVMVGMALHFEATPEDEQDWLDLWDAWSAQCEDRYEEGDTATRWKSFSREHPNARRLVSVVKEVQEKQSRAKFEQRDEWKAKITAETDGFALQDTIPREIARDVLLDKDMREALAPHLKARIKTVTGETYSIATVREWIKPVTPTDVHGHDIPEWINTHVWVVDEQVFFSLDRRARIKSKSFDMQYNRYMDRNPDTGKAIMSATDAASDLYDIKTVTRVGYHPHEPLFFESEGTLHVNLYNPNSAPEMPDSLGMYEQEAVDIVMGHIALMFPEPRERQLFMSWLAFVVQHPGHKVRWAPYISGPPGDGKTFFTALLGAVMGAVNVGTMGGSQLGNGSDFSDWAVGSAVKVIEEMKLGVDKYDAVNKLKPYLTNDYISVHPKGQPAYKAFNATQYLILSNYGDGVPIDDGDRRFFFLRTSFSEPSLLRFLDENPDHHNRIYGAVEGQAGALRYWLMHFNDWHPEFQPNGRAPRTAARELAIDSAASDIDIACQVVAREGRPGVTGSWVASASFVAAVMQELGPDSKLGKQAIARIVSQYLAKIGYVYMGGERHYVTVNGKSVQTRIWKHESVAVSPEDWWAVASAVLSPEKPDSESQGFLD